jgi:energy-coupling factor transport system permease protein
MAAKMKLDPRTKLALGIMGLVAILITRGRIQLLIEFLLLTAGLFMGGMFGQWMRSLRLLIPMTALVFIIALLTFDLSTGLELSLRLINLLTVSFVFFQTIIPDELGGSLTKMGIPYEFSFILTTSLRYVPLIARRIRAIVEAQRSRGIDLRPRVKNVPHYLALLMPLLVQSFILSEQLAMAMEARGFTRKGRSHRKEYHISALEYGLMAMCLAVLTAFAVWARG